MKEDGLTNPRRKTRATVVGEATEAQGWRRSALESSAAHSRKNENHSRCRKRLACNARPPVVEQSWSWTADAAPNSGGRGAVAQTEATAATLAHAGWRTIAAVNRVCAKCACTHVPGWATLSRRAAAAERTAVVHSHARVPRSPCVTMCGADGARHLPGCGTRKTAH